MRSRRSQVTSDRYLRIAQTALILGDVSRAREAIEITKALNLTTQVRLQYLIFRARLSRYSANGDKDWSERWAKLVDSDDADIAWERLIEDGLPAPDKAFSFIRTTRDPVNELRTWLLLATFPQDMRHRQLRSIANFRRRHQLPEHASTEALYQVAFQLEKAFDKERPDTNRVELMEKARLLLSTFDDPDMLMLRYLAVARCYLEIGQPGPADVVRYQYHQYCLQLSGGASKDLLRISAYIENVPLTHLPQSIETTLQTKQAKLKLPLGYFESRSQIAKLMLQIAQIKANGWITGFRTNDEDKRFKESKMIARTIARAMGERKGVILKVGQAVGFLNSAFDKAVREEFEVLHAQMPHMDAKVIAEQFERALGTSPTSVFKTWNPEPIAAGSLGQVHLAATHDGRQVAVKVQYPGIAEMVMADLKSTRLLARMFKRS